MPVGVLPGLVLLAASVRVEGTTTCPTPEMVATHLAELMPRPASGPATSGQVLNDGGADASDRARLSDDAGELVVVLEGPGGDVVGTRRFPRSYSCDGLASAVAVSISVWDSDVHPAFSSSIPARTAEPVGVARVSAPPLASLAADSARWRAGAGLALGLGGSVDVPAVAADLLLEAWLRPPLARTALRAELEGQTEREVTLQEGKGIWRRWILGLGAERTLTPGTDVSGAGWLRAYALARVALLDVRGEGFTLDHRQRVVDPGAAAGLRAVGTRGDWASWAEVGAALWPLGHDVLATTGTNSTQRLPAFEAFVRVGAGWGAGR